MTDIRSEGFDANNMHFGPTGAMNDAAATADGTKVKEMLESAPKVAAQSQPGA